MSGCEKLVQTLAWVDLELGRHGYPEPSPIRVKIREALFEHLSESPHPRLYTPKQGEME